MNDAERYKLLYGPYAPPKCQVGDKLTCEYRGRELAVRLMTDAPIQWPANRGGKLPAVIVCGDLIRALRVESEISVAFHWGVSIKTVWHWRRALGVPRTTKGTLRLAIDYTDEKLTPEVRAKADDARRLPEYRARSSAQRVGRPLHPNMVAAQREALWRPKSDEWKRIHSGRMRRMWEHPEEHGLPARHTWTDEENALLGTQSDAAIAKVLGVSEAVVYQQRRRLGIAHNMPRWTEAEISLLGTATDREVGQKLGKTGAAVRRKRLELKIPSAAPHWTAEEVALLGTDVDSKIARRLGRTPTSVEEKRRAMGIPGSANPWTSEEEALLGTLSDEDVATIVGRTVEAVRLRRCKFGIPAYRAGLPGERRAGPRPPKGENRQG